MATEINRTDSFNTGREKLNNAIKAFNETVVEGDSSVEAAQARVDKVGKTYDTLKDRIDAQQLLVDVKSFGAVGDGITDDTQAFLDAISYLESLDTSGSLYVPNGEFLVTSDLVITKDYFTFMGEGKSSFVNLQGARILLDAITKGAHIYGFSIKDIKLERQGTAGPAIEFLGQNLMGVARTLFDSVHITKSTGTGLKMSGTWIIDIVSPVISGCATNGLEMVLAPDGNSSVNALKVHGGEIQGNGTGVYMEGVSGVSFFGTSIEGNTSNGVNLANNNRSVGFYIPYFEKNGSTANDRDLIVGDVNYSGTKATGTSLALINPIFWDGANSTKDYAIELSRTRAVKITNAQFNSYEVGGINNNPEFTSELTGYYENCVSNNGIVANDSKLFKKSLEEAYVTHTGTHDFPSISAGGSSFYDFTISGVKNGDFVQVSSGSSLQGLSVSAFVHTTDTVRVVLNNNTSSAVDVSNSTFRFLIIPYDYFV